MREAFFLDGRLGRLFCLRERPADDRASHVTLILPPFAEEMNKSRHVLAELAGALAAAGHDVLMPDLYGTGDSEGDFGDASMTVWRDDMTSAIDCLPAGLPVHVLGLRSGALLAAEFAIRETRVAALTLIHPVIDGAQQLTQWLRLRLAAGLADGSKEGIGELRRRLADGEPLEIAGYRISPKMARELGELSLRDLVPPRACRVNWIELAASEDRPLMPLSTKIIDSWVAGGVQKPETRVIACDQFWSTQEIAACPKLIETVAELAGGLQG